MSTTNGNHTTSIEGSRVIEKVGNRVVSDKDLAHVLGGYRATLSNDTTSAEAKAHAEERIKELEEMTEEGAKTDSDEHHHRVVGGLKAALHNAHVKEETKVEIRQRLAEMGEDVQVDELEEA